jgi:hypothetical protein
MVPTRSAALALICAILAGCGAATPSAPASVAPSPATSVAPSVALATPTPTPTPTSTPTSTPTATAVPSATADIQAIAAHLVAEIDEADQIYDSGADLTGWAVSEGTWVTDHIDATLARAPAISAYLPKLQALLQAVNDGADTTDALVGLIGSRHALAEIAGVAATTPEPTPVHEKPITFKGKGRTNTKPFNVAGGDYTAVISGVGDGNVIAHLTLRDKSDYEPLFNEIVHGKYRYELIVYAVEPGSYFFEMEVDGTWTISLTPFTG